ncbi:MAG TPA: DUF493 domain-containing protein [Woeseiaceae bacterium]|nr:DUF493 domain-containing protein [Woeseiaceae bacterium]
MRDDADKSPLQFPCDFPVKMMGYDRATFYEAARGIIERHAGSVSDDDVRTASSRNGRFVSMTITVRAHSRQQLDAIYMDLTQHDEILVAL